MPGRDFFCYFVSLRRSRPNTRFNQSGEVWGALTNLPAMKQTTSRCPFPSRAPALLCISIAKPP